MPKVSVLVPVYKTNETYLREAIESILNQTFTDFELLLLDDCPEDDREAIVKSYNDSRIKYAKNEKNIGISKSRNKLINWAQGEYLAIFDHDDISLPERLEKEAAYLDSHPEVGVVSCWADVFPVETIKFHFAAEDSDIKMSLMAGCVLVHSASMIRKSVLDKNNIRYEEEFSPSEDYCLWLRLIPFTEFHNLQEVLFKYRQYETNTTRLQAERMARAGKRLLFMAHMNYPTLFHMYLEEKGTISHIKFCGIPLIKIVANSRGASYYLFDFIPFLRIKRKVLFWSNLTVWKAEK